MQENRRLFVSEILQRASLLSVVLAVCCAYVLYIVVEKYLEYRADTAFGLRHGCLPPLQIPNRWPLGLEWIRRLWHWDSKQHLLQFLSSVADDYEPRTMLSQYLLFGPRTFHISSPKNVEAVLSTNFQDYGFGVRHGVFSPLLGNGIFTQEGPAWKHSRELLRNQFVRTQYQNLEQFREHVNNLLACLPTSKGVIDLQPLFFKLTLDTTTALLLGQSIHSLQAEEIADTGLKAFAASWDTASGDLAKRYRLAPLHFLYDTPQFRRACTEVHHFVDGYIQERDEKRNNNPQVQPLDSFLDQISQESTSHTMVRDHLLNILLAGRDTTACCLSWTIRLLIRHPSVMERLRKEVHSVLSDEEHPTREKIRKMPYLALVIKESLRLFPPVPMNNRTATKTTILPTGGGPDGTAPILVRRGELVAFGQYVLSRRKNIYGPDADKFRPERWEGHEPGIMSGWAYFPFHGGPRACLGQDFALMEVSYTVVRLLQAFPIIELPADEKRSEMIGSERQRLTLVLSSADGCRVELDRESKR